MRAPTGEHRAPRSGAHHRGAVNALHAQHPTRPFDPAPAPDPQPPKPYPPADTPDPPAPPLPPPVEPPPAPPPI